MLINCSSSNLPAGKKKLTSGLLNKFRSSVSTFALVCTAVFSSSIAFAESYNLFETGQVRPLAMSPDGKQLFALNTPDNRLEIFDITTDGLSPAGSVIVGMEPVALAARSNNEVWVVNSVSDSVSIVDIAKQHVTKTLLVGDEPMDIVFAGDNKGRAFITTAHRGQNSPIDPQLTTPGIGRADVWVFDAATVFADSTLGGTPLNIITLFTDSPRALAVSADGSKVYAAGFKTGNQTTVITETIVTDNGGAPLARLTDMDGKPFPDGKAHMVDVAGNMQPLTSLIVKYNPKSKEWLDESGKDWSKFVKFDLPDKDVFVIDANAEVPAEIDHYSGVGTIIFNMISNPVTGKVYVTNTEALNQNRFTGPAGSLPPLAETPDAARIPFTTVQGHFAESRITVLDSKATPIHLNKHIDYSACCDAIDNTVNAKSLAQPMDMAISSDGKTLYVAAFGSGKVGVFNTTELENDTFEPDLKNQIQLSAGGPAGVVLDEANKRLYVLTRFDNAISIVDTDSNTEVDHIAMYNPEPSRIVDGRRYLYDASFTSSHGDSSCALCHVFGDMDQLSWDLGSPSGAEVTNPSASEYLHGPSDLAINHDDFELPANPHFAPVKGPMSTQSLRGLANHGAMHWRGDKTGGTTPGDAPETNNAQPDDGIFDEHEAFTQFNEAFVNLHGRDTEIPHASMNEFARFALELMYPPNPIRHLDDSLTTVQQAGKDFFFDPTKTADTAFHCNGCHIVDRTANQGFTNKAGFFGTDGKNTFAFIQQFLKVPHLRNMYNKVGMFGMANNSKYLADDPFTGMDPTWNPTIPEEFQKIGYVLFFANENQHMGDQIKGFGYTQEGSADTVFRFHTTNGFLPRAPGTVTKLDPGNGPHLDITPEGMEIRRNLEQYLMVFPTNFFPIMGQQITLTETNGAIVGPRIDLMMARAELGECDLVAVTKAEKGYLYIGGGAFKTHEAAEAPWDDAKLRGAAKNGKTVTYTCAPPGSGMRIALDRDEDGALNGDEENAGTDPADPSSFPVI
ncbi:YncE family protein [Kaarinaea lacus]